jgi:hypothetical protein
MAEVQNMSGIIASKVGCGLGMVMQNATKGVPALSGGTEAGEDAKPYSQDQIATFLGFHGAMNVKYLKKVGAFSSHPKRQTTIIFIGPLRSKCYAGRISTGAGLRKGYILTTRPLMSGPPSSSTQAIALPFTHPPKRVS